MATVNSTVQQPLHAFRGLECSDALQQLYQVQQDHPFWQSRLLKACRAGSLDQQDLRELFAQYFLYSRNFTRYLASLMANCDSDYFRSRLSENLWEEGGGAEPDKRHAEIFRRFLRGGLGIDIDAIQYQGFTKAFVHEYLEFCRNASPLAASAFLSLGTEAVVPGLYAIFCEALAKAGIPDEKLEFFHIHMACDDDHARTLAELVESYAGEAGWLQQAKVGIERALDLRLGFFEDLYDFILQSRLHGVLERIRTPHSLFPEAAANGDLVIRADGAGAGMSPLYRNTVEELNIEFAVRRVNFSAEVFDVRLVEIAPGKNNEKHRHPHESLLSVIRGCGRILLDDHEIKVGPGDTVFVPRWAVHQTHNSGAETLVVLATTDYALTQRVFSGDHLKTTRFRPEQDADSTLQ
jgi:pyrroloquinoline quinone (PQQ) biosynthesis protein C/quercetin dioxygenase-like cupin family protein